MGPTLTGEPLSPRNLRAVNQSEKLEVSRISYILVGQVSRRGARVQALQSRYSLRASVKLH